MPTTFAELGIDSPDIPTMVSKLHENKGDVIGSYMQLCAEQTAEIYRLML
jgi:alcohol dehydrogenase YqhD (iron-dependent ADH family)